MLGEAHLHLWCKEGSLGMKSSAENHRDEKTFRLPFPQETKQFRKDIFYFNFIPSSTAPTLQKQKELESERSVHFT